MIENLKTWLLDAGVESTWVDALVISIGVVSIILVAILFHFIAKQIILRTVIAVIRRSKTDWDDVLIEKKVLARVAHFAPAIVVN
jgi:miniconductance mechanosensitive channel